MEGEQDRLWELDRTCVRCDRQQAFVPRLTQAKKIPHHVKIFQEGRLAASRADHAATVYLTTQTKRMCVADRLFS